MCHLGSAGAKGCNVMAESCSRVWAEYMACVPVHTRRPETALRVPSVCSWGVSRIPHSAWVSRLLPSTPPHPRCNRIATFEVNRK